MDSYSLLLVEDDEIDASALRRQLRRSLGSDFRIERATTLESAESIAASSAFDAILLDLTLPDSNGLGTLRAVRRVAPDVPVIILTGDSDVTLAMESLRVGAQEYLNKADLTAVERTIRYAVQRKEHELEQRRIEGELQQAQKLESLGLLAGQVAHDFNNILTVILGHASLGRTHASEGSKEEAKFDHITVAAGRAADLCKQLLAYSGEGRSVVEPVDLPGVVRGMRSMLEMSISKDAELHTELGEAPTIQAVEAQVQQVIMNLVTNASDALEGGVGEIWVRSGFVQCVDGELETVYPGDTLPPGTYATFEVRDTGTGMSATVRQQMFHPFFSTKEPGRGLGLSAVLGIVRAHRAGIQVESTVGEGATVKLFFPVGRDPVEPGLGEHELPLVSRQASGEQDPAARVEGIWLLRSLRSLSRNDTPEGCTRRSWTPPSGVDAPSSESRLHGWNRYTLDAMDTLLIEDDEIDVEAIGRAFAKAGLERPTHLGFEGQQALEQLRSRAANGQLSDRTLVLLDLNMVGMSGFEFLDELRKDPALRNTVVFVLTTSSDSRDLQRAYGRCVSGYVVKSRAGRHYEHLIELIKSFSAAVEFPQRKPLA